MKLNKHGLPMRGLRTVAGETKTLNPYDNGYLQVNYDRKTGEVWTDYHYSIGGNSWTEYHNKNIITVACLKIPRTMQEIADIIAEYIAEDVAMR